MPLAEILPQRSGVRSFVSSEEIQELAASLESLGQVTPIQVTEENEGYRLVAGRRRCEAANLCGWSSVLAIVVERDDRDLVGLAAAENLARADMAPSDEGVMLRELLDQHGMSLDEVARFVGHSPDWVSGRLEVLDWPPELRAAVDQGALPLGAGRWLMQIPDEDYRLWLIECGVRSGISVGTAKQWARDFKTERRQRSEEELREIAEASEGSLPEVFYTCRLCEGEGKWPHVTTQLVCADCVGEIDKVKEGGLDGSSGHSG